ncbi:MAG TPA: MFS transporter [Prolixibacteraceae bacterium]|nr:MFS transporter [Prolixibacteraceae bacterium]
MTKMDQAKPIIKGDPKMVNAWVMYDWSNSVYQLTISSTIFPIYYNAVTRNGDDYTVSFFGFNVVNTVLYSWAIAAAYLIVAAGSPLFSSIADYTGRRKGFMRAFTLIGAVSCGALYFFDSQHIELGIIAFSLGTLGYGGSIVFYNSFLPVIAEPKDQDRISARGYMMGYLGGVILLLFNLLMIMKPGLFGFPAGSTQPARISFLTVCIWWIGFSSLTFMRLPKYTFGKRVHRENVILNGYKELRMVFNQIRGSFQLSIYLLGIFFVLMGILTTMFMAANFGGKELGLGEEVLIPTIMGIQLIAMFGAWSFAKLSGKIGNIRSMIISVIIWISVCFYAYTIKHAVGFIVVASAVGFVMGGSQSLARSTYSKMLPETTDHTSFFSFYDVNEKLATVAGTFSFGIIEAMTGSMRYSVLAITIFFGIGLLFFVILLFSDGKGLKFKA